METPRTDEHLRMKEENGHPVIDAPAKKRRKSETPKV